MVDTYEIWAPTMGVMLCWPAVENAKKLHKNRLICKILAESSQGLKGNMVNVSGAASQPVSQSVSQRSVSQSVSQSVKVIYS